LVLIGIKVGVYELTKRAHGEATNAASINNLYMLGLAITMYGDDFNGKFPDLTDIQSLSNAVEKYVAGTKCFTHPETGQPYQLNSALTHQKRPGTNSPSVVILYEPEPAFNGTHGVLLADGPVDRVNESRWQELKKTSNIP